MKVYIVTIGAPYSEDTWVSGVYSTKEKAEKVVDQYNNTQTPESDYYTACYQEYTIDEELDE